MHSPMPRLHSRLARLVSDLRPGVPHPPLAVIMTDEDAAEYQAWVDALAAEDRDAIQASGRVFAVDFRIRNLVG